MRYLIIKSSNDKLNIFTTYHNPIFTFIVCPLLAYECFFNFMPIALLYSSLIASILFTISFFLLLIPFIEVLSAIKNISVYFFYLTLNLNHKAKVRKILVNVN